MSKNINIISEDVCTGCGACNNCCPVDAIEMLEDQEGFKYPNIDMDKCISCGKCINVCPEANVERINQNLHEEPECYAAMADTTIRIKSSSGGVFAILAESIYQRNGLVCGAVYADDYKSVYHIVSDDRQDLDKIRGSKYVQSDIGKCFCKIKHALEEDKFVLFSGCPCQVSGLYMYLGKQYEKLITIDVVCHGVNSLKAYNSYIAELAKGRIVEKVNFRDKTIHGWSSIVNVKFTDGSQYDAAWNKNQWYALFLGGVINRKCCATCHYAKINRIGDITLGDFWQVHRWDESCNDWKGTSLVLLNSEKGKKVYKELERNLILSKEAPLEHAIKYNGALRQPTSMAPGRKYFFNHLKDGYHKAYWYGREWRYDVGLIGWWFSANYGSVLTYFAMGKVLQDMNLLPILIRIPKLDGSSWEEITEENIKFMEKYFHVSNPRSYSQLKEVNKFCDSFMLGSDQLWVSAYNKILGYTFYLDFADSDKKKIAYATSMGYDRYDGSDEDKKIVKTLLKRFDGISVRETESVSLCKKEFDLDIVRNLDPVFLCKQEHYDMLAKESQIQVDEKYNLAYILDPTDEKKMAIQSLKELTGVETKIILDMKNFDKSYAKWSDMDIIDKVSVPDFVKLIRNCNFLLTDSHHGVCFGMIYHKKFLAIRNPRRGAVRFDSLFKLFEMENCLTEEGNILESLKKAPSPDYERIDLKMKSEKARSLEWMQSMLIDNKHEQEELVEDIFAKYFHELQCMKAEQK